MPTSFSYAENERADRKTALFDVEGRTILKLRECVSDLWFIDEWRLTSSSSSHTLDLDWGL
jgi:hypothetical protein